MSVFCEKGKTSLCDIGHIGTGGWLRVSAARNDNDPIYCCDRLSAVLGRLQKRDLLAAAVAVLTIAGISAGNRQYIGLDTKDTAFPLTHWVMMSMTSPGSHNEADETYTASFPTAEEKRRLTGRDLQKSCRQ